MRDLPTTFQATLLRRMLALSFSSLLLHAPDAAAQSNAGGVVRGQVAGGAGQVVVLRNVETNATRTVPVDASGKFQATALPAGRYEATLMNQSNPVGKTEVEVLAGQGVQADFGTAGIQVVNVSGRRSQIDVTSTNNGTVFTGKELARIPVATNLTSVALLAPNTTRADAAFGGASFGGSGASENAFYVNGFPVTNPLSNLGSSELPFGSIAQVSVMTGGFGAEFGRSIGGVMNVTTRSGTNTWETGVSGNVTPRALTSKTVNIRYPNTGQFPATDGTIHFRRELDTADANQAAAYLGGPLVHDKLFMFAAIDRTVNSNGFANNMSNTTLARDGWNDVRTVSQRYLAKLDWNISDRHRLEWMALGDTNDVRTRTYGFDKATGGHTDVKYSEANARNVGGNGSGIQSLRYIGQWTDDLTVTALYGENRAKRGTTYEDYDINGILRSVSSTPEAREPGLDALGLYKNYQKYGANSGGNLSLPGEDKVRALRLDLEYKLGEHTIRAGLDDIRIASSNAGSFTAGGGVWTYAKLEDGAQFEPTNLSIGREAILANYGGLGTKGYYVNLFTFSSITNSGARQSAQYIEDRFQLTPNLLLIGGLRNEQYSNSLGDGVKFIDIRGQLAPRLSASWDVRGDASLKLFASAGRYHLPLPSQVAARAAGKSSLLLQDFTYSGIDALGQPTGLVPVNTPATPDGELGQDKDPRAVVSKTLKPNYQDELTLGMEMAYNPRWNLGVKATYRKLGGGIDDSCDLRPILRYAASKHYEPDPLQLLCYIFNPGDDVTLWSADANGGGRYVTIGAAELGYPKAKRTYAALDFFLEHPLNNGWYGKATYTLSRSAGNMEGQTRSDTQQSDVGISAGWDFPEFMANVSGVLPNDRQHVLKAYGYYELGREWSVGGNLLVSSGRPKVCIGTDTETDSHIGYGPEYFFCDGKASPRGSLGRMPTQVNLDLSIGYSPAALKGLTVKLDVFNVFNRQTPLTRRETREDGGGQLLNNYDEVRNTAAARSVRIGAGYVHKF